MQMLPIWHERVKFFVDLSEEEQTRYCFDFLQFFTDGERRPRSVMEEILYQFPLLYQYVWSFRREFYQGDEDVNWFQWWQHRNQIEIRLEDDMSASIENDRDRELLLALKSDPHTYQRPRSPIVAHTERKRRALMSSQAFLYLVQDNVPLGHTLIERMNDNSKWVDRQQYDFVKLPAFFSIFGLAERLQGDPTGKKAVINAS
ncbi:hypothetical protein GGR53DRAFT_462409 [Hypoxylon sp. FL1150]|nr:hypothetical protein GGR53DRAFT_462409 [Hypoxylon sp. FL1150]